MLISARPDQLSIAVSATSETPDEVTRRTESHSNSIRLLMTELEVIRDARVANLVGATLR